MSEDQLIGDSELDGQATNSLRIKPDLSAVSRRPAGLLGQTNLARLSCRTNRSAVIYFVAHYSFIIAGAYLLVQLFDSVAFWPVFFIHSFIIGFLFSPLHEFAHGTAFRNRFLNEAALWITAIVYVVPPYYFRYFHLGHHRYTQVPGRDPSLVLPKPASLKQYWWYCAALWFWWRNLSWMVKHSLGLTHPSSKTYVPEAKRSLMIIEARVLCLFYGLVVIVCIYFGIVYELLVCWLLPRFVGEPIQRMMRVAEHVGCDESPNLLTNTRTTLTNRFINAIAWQMPYHAEHHLFPNVPFHALPGLHELVGEKLTVERGGYLIGQWHIIKLVHNGSKTRNEMASSPPLL